MSTRQPSRWFILIGLAGWLALAGYLAAAESSAAAALDPVVADVVEMLQAGVDEGAVIQWLESTDRHPGDVGSAGMIALSQAGASERLIDALLVSIRKEPSAVATAESAEAAVSATGGRVEIVTTLTAKRVWAEESSPDEPRQQPWDVFLYLDGELLAWTRPSLAGDPVEVHRVIDAGRRELRVVLQRYEELGQRWEYESLVVPTLFSFEAGPGVPIVIDVEMVRLWGLWRQRDDGGPLRYSIRQGDRILAEDDGSGGDPDRWQPICEDVKANFAGADKVPGRYRNPMSRCVDWATLWTGAGTGTSRAAILAQLAEFDFAPPLR